MAYSRCLIMRNKPRIRFKGFTEDWEQRKLGDIASITGGGTPSTNISEYWNGDIDWYSPVEIGENRYVSGSTRKITKLGLEKSSAKILPVGTVLFTSRAGIGNTAILQVEGCTNQGFQSITPNSKALDTYFLYTMTPKLKRYGEVTGAGSTFVEVSGKQMEQMNLMIPSIEEQKCVSQLFKAMDDSITLHQRKLEKLKLAKKALLQKLFPKNGSQFPEIRFKGFTDAWEQRKLGDTNTFFTDGNYGNDYPAANEMSDSINGVPFLRGSNLDNGAINLMDVHYITKQKHNLLTSGHTKFDDIIIAVRGSLGSCGYVAKQFIDININSQLAIIRTNKNELSGLFLIEYLLSYLGKKEINRNITGTALKQLPINSLKMINIKYPSINEQEKISILLSKLNTGITLHQRKLDKLQEVKKGLLQKMFV